MRIIGSVKRERYSDNYSQYEEAHKCSDEPLFEYATLLCRLKSWLVSNAFTQIFINRCMSAICRTFCSNKAKNIDFWNIINEELIIAYTNWDVSAILSKRPCVEFSSLKRPWQAKTYLQTFDTLRSEPVKPYMEKHENTTANRKK